MLSKEIEHSHKESKPGYYAVIPANVRYDKKLTPNAKLLYGEITALCNQQGYCWAGNDYFAKLYKVSKSTISRWISQLNHQGYIDVEIVYKNGSKEIEERRISLPEGGGIRKDEVGGIRKKRKGNTTKSNNTKDKNKTDRTAKPPGQNNIKLGVSGNDKEKSKEAQEGKIGDKMNQLYLEVCHICGKAKRNDLVAAMSQNIIKELQRLLYPFHFDDIVEVFKDTLSGLQAGGGWSEIFEEFGVNLSYG